MSAYMIAQIEIADPEEYQNYFAGFMSIFQRYGGELLATPPSRLRERDECAQRKRSPENRAKNASKLLRLGSVAKSLYVSHSLA